MHGIRKEHENLLLQVTGLTKQFGGVRAQDNVSFGVEQGSVLGLIGPNGAGKTTLFNMITGVCVPDKGEILFDGRSIISLPVHERVTAGIARTFQNVELFPGMTVLENLRVGMHVRLKSGFWGAVIRSPRVVKEERQAREKALSILEFTGLLSYADRQAVDGAAVQEDLPPVRGIHPGDHVEQGGLAGAVGPDQPQDAALFNVKGDVVLGPDPAKLFCEPRDLQQQVLMLFS